jgi:hypothetical protein
MNSIVRLVSSVLLVALASASALAANPRMGGSMKHVMVGFDGQSLNVMVDEAVPTPVMRDYNEQYSGNAGVLNDTMYNAQYGWMVMGAWQRPAGTQLWIELVGQSPALRTYHGGTMMNQGTFAPIFATAGSSPRIAWSGSMLHNWYATQQTGDHQATYRVYLGDAEGAEVAVYGAAFVTLTWSAPLTCGDIDFNNDGSLFDPADIDAFLSVFSEGPCIPVDGTCDGIDFNNDGSLFDPCDIDSFLLVFSEGPCTSCGQ